MCFISYQRLPQCETGVDHLVCLSTWSRISLARLCFLVNTIRHCSGSIHNGFYIPISSCKTRHVRDMKAESINSEDVAANVPLYAVYINLPTLRLRIHRKHDSLDSQNGWNIEPNNYAWWATCWYWWRSPLQQVMVLLPHSQDLIAG
jgi:hypothetical protein